MVSKIASKIGPSGRNLYCLKVDCERSKVNIPRDHVLKITGERLCCTICIIQMIKILTIFRCPIDEEHYLMSLSALKISFYRIYAKN